MKILFLTNNPITRRLSDWLEQEACEQNVTYEGKISNVILDREAPDLVISYNYRHFIPKDVVAVLGGRAINLHISLLPWNKGADPNVWSFLEDTPKGVTIHLIDEGIDTGNILLQKELFFNEGEETLMSTYNILHKEIQDLFMKNWEQLKRFEIAPKISQLDGSRHMIKDFAMVKGLLGKEGWDITINELKRRYREIQKQRWVT
ncbi:MAG: Linear gramicidin synthase subunit A [Syntrophorhabdus sp. PtaU1.Bin050]|nr:MAG: Linear gramicidin synthase subunit A [Syntrophorhabdus sp. PtaU1.Bin050]